MYLHSICRNNYHSKWFPIRIGFQRDISYDSIISRNSKRSVPGIVYWNRNESTRLNELPPARIILRPHTFYPSRLSFNETKLPNTSRMGCFSFAGISPYSNLFCIFCRSLFTSRFGGYASLLSLDPLLNQ